MNENEILDDKFELGNRNEKPKPFNYAKYTITYIVLMLTIGTLLTKIMSPFPRSYVSLIGGAFAYTVIAFMLALIQKGIEFLYRKLMKKESSINPKHPIWFRLLESCFYIWCVIVLITFVGNKVV